MWRSKDYINNLPELLPDDYKNDIKIAISYINGEIDLPKKFEHVKLSEDHIQIRYNDCLENTYFVLNIHKNGDIFTVYNNSWYFHGDVHKTTYKYKE